MARQVITTTINPTTGAITVTGISTVDPTQVASVYDTTLKTLDGSKPLGQFPYPKGYPLYTANMAPCATAAGAVLTLPLGLIPPQVKSTDVITVNYGYAVTPQVVEVVGQG
jgi:hypothetical protein